MVFLYLAGDAQPGQLCLVQRGLGIDPVEQGDVAKVTARLVHGLDPTGDFAGFGLVVLGDEPL